MPEKISADFTAILLAAGQSKRFGSPKLLHPLNDGTPLGLIAAQKLCEVFANVLVVINPHSPELAQQYRALGVQVIVNPYAAQGLGTSLALGIAQSANSQGWLIALADMPFIKTETIRIVADSLIQGAKIAAPCYQGKRGHPVGFAQQFKNELLQLNQDTGANQLLQRYAEQVHLIATDDSGILQDIDTPDDLVKTNKH
ncbi:MAG: nucleotidyltransferase family protein [Thiolinea sp.]